MKRYSRPTLVLLLFVTVLLAACGKTSVEINDSTYEPKIVLNGLLNPAESIIKIEVNRNFPIGQTINREEIPLRTAEVLLSEDIPGEKQYRMHYNEAGSYFELAADSLTIDYDKTYRLQVTAEIDGQTLSTSATTTIPGRGMRIREENPRELFYRQVDQNLALITPTIDFEQSSGVSMYLLSYAAEDTSDENFVQDNPFGMDLKEFRKQGNSAKDLQYGFSWKIYGEEIEAQTAFEVNWFRIWFYGRYRFILYACDINYYHYFVTHRDVMGMDGNLHEPVFEIEGDGIGLFGSVLTDTTYFNIKRLP